MNQEEINMHLAAGRYYGKVSACGKKVKHDTFERADRHAFHQNYSGGTHTVEPYPCYWCSPDRENGIYSWHVGREMDESERELFNSSATALLEMEEIKIQVAEPKHGEQVGERTLRVHNRKLCLGQNCCIHNPSDHQMKDWPLNWRGDRRIMERICPHGIGHPDPDDADYRKTQSGEYDSGIHGCDGCCWERRDDIERDSETASSDN